MDVEMKRLWRLGVYGDGEFMRCRVYGDGEMGS